MQKINLKNGKQKIATIVLILLLTTTAFYTVFSPSAKALGGPVATSASVGISPNPAGVGQTVTVNMWILPITPTGDTFFHGFMLTITDPSGQNTTQGPFNSWPIGSYYSSFTPKTLGNYTFQFFYPGETILGFNYAAAMSPPTVLTVQQDWATTMTGQPLPTSYWTRPIYGENREWASISGDWLQMAYNASGKSATDSLSAFNPYSQAPLSSHIQWMIQKGFGGIVGGTFGDISYYTGLSYEDDAPIIIMDGRLYYMLNYKTMGNQTMVCVDLRSGQEYWRKDVTYPNEIWSGTAMSPSPQNCISLGQLLNFQSGNQFGVIPYLWDTGPTYRMYDAFTGDLICSFANATSASKSGNNVQFDANGNMLVYTLDATNGFLYMWNSTYCFLKNNLIPAYTSGMQLWRPMPGTYDWRKGIQWNVTVTKHPAITLTAGNTLSINQEPIIDNVMVMYWGESTNLSYHIGYSTIDGHEMWAFDRMTSGAHEYSHFSAFGDGEYAQWDAAQRQWVCYDIQTGVLKWRSDPQDYPYGAYMGNSLGGCFAYGTLYSMGYDGKVYAFNATTGKLIWKFYAGNAGAETPYGSWPFYGGPIVADGVVFANNGEHSPNQPLYRGEKLYGIDAYTGQNIWNITGWLVCHAIADGYLITKNNYDNYMYCFGLGQSATTVSAPADTQTLGTQVLIKGTVTDQSSAQKGTPAISDTSMSAWMEYLHMQKPMPKDAIGVQVSLDTIDPNGNYVHIGNTTSDTSGIYSYAWTPQIPGKYTIIASFSGSNSYGPSSSETAMNVVTAPTSTPVAETVKPVDSTPIIIGVGVAIIVALAISTLLIIRKRP